MKALTIKDTIKFDNKEELVKFMLYKKLSDFEGLIIDGEKVTVSDNDLNILSLFIFSENKEDVLEESLKKNYVKSKQAGENCVTRFVNLGVLMKIGKKRRIMNPIIFPKVDADVVICNLTLYNE